MNRIPLRMSSARESAENRNHEHIYNGRYFHQSCAF